MATNNPEYAFHEMFAIIGGRRIRFFSNKFKAMNFETDYIFGNSDKPVAIQTGKNSPEGSLEIIQSDYQALLDAAGGESKLPHLSLDVVIGYKPKIVGIPNIIKVLCGVRFASAEEGMAEGDFYAKIPLDYKFLDIKTK